ncbi:MAG: hypothetical protein JW741_16850 [Sedimentisphaerales bacterium]|nr:hypothetical protein [Sedimentisphaerales bacterium]
MGELTAAKYNSYWFLSFVVPAVILFAAAYWHRRGILIVGVLLSLSAAIPLRIAAVRVRWDRQREATALFEGHYASWDHDPAAMVEVAFIAPVQAFLSAGFWSLYWWFLWPRVRGRRRESLPADATYPRTLEDVVFRCAEVCVKWAPALLILFVWLTYASCVAWQYHNYATDDPMSDTGSSLFLGFVVRTGFILASWATVIIAGIWLLSYAWYRATRHREIPEADTPCEDGDASA